MLGSAPQSIVRLLVSHEVPVFGLGGVSLFGWVRILLAALVSLASDPSLSIVHHPDDWGQIA